MPDLLEKTRPSYLRHTTDEPGENEEVQYAGEASFVLDLVLRLSSFSSNKSESLRQNALKTAKSIEKPYL